MHSKHNVYVRQINIFYNNNNNNLDRSILTFLLSVSTSTMLNFRFFLNTNKKDGMKIGSQI